MSKKNKNLTPTVAEAEDGFNFNPPMAIAQWGSVISILVVSSILIFVTGYRHEHKINLGEGLFESSMKKNDTVFNVKVPAYLDVSKETVAILQLGKHCMKGVVIDISDSAGTSTLRIKLYSKSDEQWATNRRPNQIRIIELYAKHASLWDEFRKTRKTY